MARMVKIPQFRDVLSDGIIYGGFWIDKYEASRSDATASDAGASSNAASQRNVVPWGSITYAAAKTAASHANRQITTIGSCHLLTMKELQALYILGRYSKVSGKFGADTTNGWNERGNTRGARDGRNSSSFECSDDPIEGGATTDRCLTGTGFKSWGHLLDGSSISNTKSGSGAGQGALGATADTIKDDSGGTGADTFDGDLQVYDLIGNVKELVDFTVTRTGTAGAGVWTIDSGFTGAGRTLPFTTNNSTFNFDDISQDPDLKALGLPVDSGSTTDTNGGKNSGKILTSSTNQTIVPVRGGSWTSNTDSPAPLALDLTNADSFTSDQAGFRVTCGLTP